MRLTPRTPSKATSQTGTDDGPPRARLREFGDTYTHTYLGSTRLQYRQGGRPQKRRPLRGKGEALAPGLSRDAEPPVRVAVLGVELDDAARRRHAHDRPSVQTRPWD